MNFAYLVVFGFGLLGLWALLYDVPGLLLYHSKEKARVSAGKRYVKTHAQTKIEFFQKDSMESPTVLSWLNLLYLHMKKTERLSGRPKLTFWVMIIFIWIAERYIR